MDCKNCKDQYYLDIIGGIAERANKRLVQIIVLLLVLLVVTNAIWTIHEVKRSENVKEIQTSEASDLIGEDYTQP